MSRSPRLAISFVALLLSSPVSAQLTERVSVATGGAQGDDFSDEGDVSDDGRFVAFRSGATNLVPGDTNAIWDIFVRDRHNGTTERVNVSSGGAQANLASQEAAISGDGRFVAFWSEATNLVAGDSNASFDVFVRDRQAGTTERVSVDSNELQVFLQDSTDPSISDDGRYVAFLCGGVLVAGDTNGVRDVFVRDRQSGTTERVSVDSSGAEGNGHSLLPRISDDGRYVVFSSQATNLVPGDTNAATDVFVHDRQTGTTERVSVDSSGAQGDAHAFSAHGRRPISSDGRYVGFYSAATNLVAGDTNATYDVFLRDRSSGTTERVSVDSGGVQANNMTSFDSISVDGRFVTFHGLASNLVPGDTNNAYDVFLRDRQSGTTARVSVDSGGAQGNSDSRFSMISADGRYVAFWGFATNLVPGDTNGNADSFLRDRDTTAFTVQCVPGVNGILPCPCGNPQAGGGLGCNNHGAGPAQSGTLASTGSASLAADTLLLHASGENNTSLTVFWTGSGSLSPTGVVHAAGIRCVTASLKRLYTGNASGGAISRPGGGDPSISVRSAAVGAPITSGNVRHYFGIYRDPNAAAPCGITSSTINLTNAGSVMWNP